jgi:hypothetical protein
MALPPLCRPRLLVVLVLVNEAPVVCITNVGAIPGIVEVTAKVFPIVLTLLVSFFPSSKSPAIVSGLYHSIYYYLLLLLLLWLVHNLTTALSQVL